MSTERVRVNVEAVNRMIADLNKAADELERVQNAVLDHAEHYLAGAFYGNVGYGLATGMKDILARKIGTLIDVLERQAGHVAAARNDILAADRGASGVFR